VYFFEAKKCEGEEKEVYLSENNNTKIFYGGA